MDKPLFEVGAKATYDNPLFMMEDEISSVNGKIWDPSEVSKHKIKRDSQLIDDLQINHEGEPIFVIDNLPRRLLHQECKSEVEDVVSTWEVLDHSDFNIFDIEVLSK